MIYFIKEVTKSEIGDELFSPVNVAQIPRFLNPPLVPNFILYNMTGVFDVNNCE